MRAPEDSSASNNENSVEAVLLPPPPRAQKSVLKSLAALDAAEEAGAAPKPAAGPRAMVVSGPVTIEGQANQPMADNSTQPRPARESTSTDPRVKAEPNPGAAPRKAADPVQPLRANAFRPNGASPPTPGAGRNTWMMRAAAIAVLLGGGWVAAGQFLPSDISALGQGGLAKLSPMQQMQKDIQAATAEIAALRERIAKLDAPDARTRQAAENESLKKSVFDLTRRVEQARAAQSASATELGARIERVRVEDARHRDEMGERLARIERQTSDGKPVASISPPASRIAQLPQNLPQALPLPPHGASTIVPRAAAVQPPAPADAEPRKAGPLAGYVLHEVQNGVALIEGRRGFIEAYPGANIPGIGRVQSIVRRGGAWVVVTSNGVIGPKYE